MSDFNLLGVTYSQKYRKCGKENCQTCQTSQGHGPYWYASKSGEQLRYVGKDLPPRVLEIARKLKEQSADLKNIEADLTQKWRAAGLEYDHLADLRRAVSNLRNGKEARVKDLQELGLDDFALAYVWPNKK